MVVGCNQARAKLGWADSEDGAMYTDSSPALYF